MLRRTRHLGITLLCSLSCVLAAACAPSPAAVSNSPTPSALATSSAAPGVGFRVLFTASTNNANQIFLYDSASSTPQQLVALGAGAAPEARFVSAQKVAFLDGSTPGSTKIMSLELGARTTSTEATVNGTVAAFAYSHDGALLAYLVHDPSGRPGSAALHVRRGSQDFSYQLNAIPGRGTGRDDELRLEYSPDDKYLLMVDTFVGSQGQAPETGQFLVLRTADNTVAFLPPSGVSANATMATWARHTDRLYYRDQVGVRTWDAGVPTVGTLAAALHWYDPAPSADDRSIAFTDIDAQFAPHVRLYDLQSKQVVATVPAARSHPIFVTAGTIWYLEERPCQSECLGGPSQLSGKVLAYSLKSKSETPLPFTDVHNLSQLSVFSR